MITVLHDMKFCNKHLISWSKTNSSGFAIEVVEDNVIVDNSDQQGTIRCVTEKRKQRAKNYRPAGTPLIDSTMKLSLYRNE